MGRDNSLGSSRGAFRANVREVTDNARRSPGELPGATNSLEAMGRGSGSGPHAHESPPPHARPSEFIAHLGLSPTEHCSGRSGAVAPRRSGLPREFTQIGSATLAACLSESMDGPLREASFTRLNSVEYCRPRVAVEEGAGVAVEGAQFQSLLEQVRELHRLADELTHSPRLHAHVRARLSWSTDVPSLPPDQLTLADEVVEMLGSPRLSSSQARELERAFFGR
jgi:hypothetical protein